MSFFSGLFSRNKTPPPGSGEPLVPTPIPALGALLLSLEKEKGSPLSQDEVNEVWDNCVCMMLPLSKQRALVERRGYEDIDPENCWDEWLIFRAEAGAEDASPIIQADAFGAD